eukprot:CAMPEP_0206324386 /NCGR_PEP_ID=MMETSP0106_2-20121207/20485_1 /ASSEMBLY_ACC=CAM_ASM_000206 /TAXON_ID=81532 /ORGANISM="Acanthoeca-like sp., Strain 10tr" /LENGTH=130 /DNA_ID=CAMNT_0053756729 /DNA_START=13 /DNA_END=403 /DNA_ORIENTATION=-
MRIARALLKAAVPVPPPGVSTEVRKKNVVIATMLGIFVAGTYGYSMTSVKQEDFSDVVPAASAVPTNPPQEIMKWKLKTHHMRPSSTSSPPSLHDIDTCAAERLCAAQVTSHRRAHHLLVLSWHVTLHYR